MTKSEAENKVPFLRRFLITLVMRCKIGVLKLWNGEKIDGKIYAALGRTYVNGEELTLLVNNQENVLILKSKVEEDGEYYVAPTEEAFEIASISFCKKYAPDFLPVLLEENKKAFPKRCNPEDVANLYETLKMILRKKGKSISTFDSCNGGSITTFFSDSEKEYAGSIVIAKEAKTRADWPLDAVGRATYIQSLLNADIGIGTKEESENSSLKHTEIAILIKGHAPIYFTMPKNPFANCEENKLIVFNAIGLRLIEEIVRLDD